MDFERSNSQSLVFAVTDGPPSEAVVNAVAKAEGRDPLDLSPLYNAIDTDAMDSLLEDSRGVDVTFQYEGYTVLVRENAEVILDPRD